ncbi:MAG: histidine phosphatase family protein [Mariprofundaceae bacterium]|nr:histidine phosphatase family protein [Mariprofundaceae bacterium]
MKKLFLIRHAKSDWGNANTKDYERPLNARGRHDASRMGAMMQQRGWQADAWLASSAKRAKETALLMGKSLAYPEAAICFRDAMYLASADTLLSEIAQVESSVQNLLVVAHNPGMGDLIHQLAGSYVGDTPTCTVAAFDLKIDHWFELMVNTRVATLIDYQTPKKLARLSDETSA